MQKAENRVLLGNEAISRGLVEAGVQFMTAYPGTPSSEVLPAVVQFRDELGLDTYAEWSTNEKVALETALAAAYSGKRTAVAMKQVGLNVAADPALSSAYIGVVGGLVLVVADDPGPHSSQTEQDTRLFALFSKIPALDPSSPQEAKDLAAYAFDLSERHQIPVILRPTVRVCHSKQLVECGPVKAEGKKSAFVPNPRRWAATPKARLMLHELLNKKLAAIEKEFETLPFNKMHFPEGGRETYPLGIVAAGMSYSYVTDVLGRMGLSGKVPVLKLAGVYPLPRALIDQFAARVERLLVIEEPDAAVEIQIRIGKPVHGRLTGHVPSHGELTPEVVEGIIAKTSTEAGLELISRDLETLRMAVGALNLPIRRPTLCPGCGHRAAFYAMRRSFPDAIFPGDIGCYTLGLNLGAVDTVHDMGASISMASGFYHAYKQDGMSPPIIATIGDGTFFHSGPAGLENAVYNGSRFVLVVLDNHTTGMTGMQPTPESGKTAGGHKGGVIDLEGLIRGCGVTYVARHDPFDLTGFQRGLTEAVEYARSPAGSVAVIILNYPCVTEQKGFGTFRKPTPVEVRRGPVPKAGKGPGLLPGYMPRHENKISPCVEACPSGNDIERIMGLAAEGRFAEAARIFYEEHPFPSTLGRVCPNPCQDSCNRSGYDGAVSIRNLERLSGDAGRSAGLTAVRGTPRKMSVAIVGAGPAGLTAAYHLARFGYEVEVLEALSEAGGMLRWSIPEYRLPGPVLGRELEFLDSLGIKLKTGVKVGTDVNWPELERFDAVLIAVGAWREECLPIPGADQEGVMKGLEFLKTIRRGEKPVVGRRVAVIGGGNTAMDAARSARRLGAEVTVYYRRTEGEMRAIPEEAKAARAEGIFFRFQSVPVSMDKGQLRKISLKMKDNTHAENASFAPPFAGVAGSSEFVTEVDTVIVAIGAKPELSFVGDDFPTGGPSLSTDPYGRTANEKIFGCGDASSNGNGTVAGAVNSGKRAALAIHAHLSGEHASEKDLRLVKGPGITAEPVHMGAASSRAGRIQASPPARMISLRHFSTVEPALSRHLSPDEAIWGFQEAELGISPAKGAAEADKRCFHCGVCTECDTCLKVCPVGAISKENGRYLVDDAKCNGCRLCMVECPRAAITMPAVTNCVACGYCVTMCECPSLIRDADGFVDIDRRTCIDCGFCAQVCPQGAIVLKEESA